MINSDRSKAHRFTRLPVTFFCIGFSLLLTACGGGDSSSSSSGSTVTSSLSTGQVVDAPINGLGYVCGSNSGITDGQGNFGYAVGSLCTFSIGSITLGSSILVPKDGIVTPYDLAYTSRQDVSNPRAIAIAQILQSLDSGANSAVITIPASVTQALAALSKSNLISTGVTPTQAQLLAIVQAAGLKNLITSAAAQTALTSYLSKAKVSTNSGSSPMIYKGFNLSGADMADEVIPGVYGKNYVYPPGPTADASYTKELPYYAKTGANVIRMPFLWERLQRNLNNNSTGNEAFNATEWGYFTTAVTALKNQGFTVILDPHNYARYPALPHDGSSNIIGVGNSPTSAAFANFWKQLAIHYKDDSKVIFGLMNEPNTMSTTSWLGIANEAIAAIRSTGATNLILVPGNNYTGAWSWGTTKDADGKTNADVMGGISDIGHNFAYDVHQYFDTSNPKEMYAGKNLDCVEVVQLLTTETGLEAFLKKNSAKAFLGEFGGGNPWIGSTASDNLACKNAVTNLLNHLNSNPQYWIGWTWWAGGPWTNGYTYRVEPDYGVNPLVDGFLMPWLTPFLN